MLRVKVLTPMFESQHCTNSSVSVEYRFDPELSPDEYRCI